jgi:FkbM family methyltransferase
MKIWNSLYMPDDEHHLIDWMQKSGEYVDGKPTYQYSKYREALKQFTNRRRVIDVGANLGLWSRVMLLDFKYVESFEPVKKYIECLQLNAPKANVYEVALGNERKFVDMACSGDSCGDTSPYSGQSNEKIVDSSVEVVLLDDYEFTEVDLIKIDCEGYELFVLQGAEQTIINNKPVIIVEQKPNKGTKFGLADDAAVQYLIGLGMRVHTVISGDYIMVW